MSRGHGKRTQRTTEIAPNTDAGRNIGLSDRQSPNGSPIPGGRPHLGNHPTVRQSAATKPPRPEFRGVMAHGVPPGPQTAHERAEAMRGPNTARDPRPQFSAPSDVPPPPPVPVYEVAAPNAVAEIRGGTFRRYTVAATGTEPTHALPENPRRIEFQIINESATSNVLMAHTRGDTGQTTSVGLLPKGMTSYQKFVFQDDLWLISADSGTPTVSIIETTGKSGRHRK
jgi:hypothetical protein